jgi:hypothetical protein
VATRVAYARKSNCLSLKNEVWICSGARCLGIVEKRFLSSEERLFHTDEKRVEKNRLGNSPCSSGTEESGIFGNLRSGAHRLLYLE